MQGEWAITWKYEFWIYFFFWDVSAVFIFENQAVWDSQEKFLIILSQNLGSQLLSLRGPGSPFCTFVREACVVHDPDCFQLETLWAALLCTGRWKELRKHLLGGGGGKRGKFKWQHPEKFVLVEPWKYHTNKRARMNVVLRHALWMFVNVFIGLV